MSASEITLLRRLLAREGLQVRVRSPRSREFAEFGRMTVIEPVAGVVLVSGLPDAEAVRHWLDTLTYDPRTPASKMTEAEMFAWAREMRAMYPRETDDDGEDL